MEQIEQIKKMWSSGMSPRAIAEELDIARADVMAVVMPAAVPIVPTAEPMRAPVDEPKPLKVAKVTTEAVPKPPKSKKYVIGKGPGSAEGPPMDVDIVPERDPGVIPLGQRCTILELTESKCKWPIGDPSSPDFFFCGGRSIEGLPYCGYHARIAYQPGATRRGRTPKPEVTAFFEI